MHTLQSLLDAHPYVIADGAMGTMLMQAGLEHGDSPEAWNIDYPDRVRAVHAAYIDAGSQIILSNTFGGSPFRLKLHQFNERVLELNRAGAQIAREAADAAERPVVVAGSMGPSGELMEPIGTLTSDAARDGFARQAEGLAAGGVDVLWIETMSDIAELRAAVEGARLATSLPIVATMTFDTRGFTMMGVSPVKALDAMLELGLAAQGGNCGNGPAEIEGVIEAMHERSPEAILVAKSNAGIPEVKGREIVYSGTPQVMAEHAVRIHQLGARIIGGCCGSTPDHIRAMRGALQTAFAAG